MKKLRFKTTFQFLIVVLALNSCSKSSEKAIIPIDKSFTYFGFKMSQNLALAQDITCEIKGDTIYASTFSGANLTNLAPSFSFEDLEISVAGKTQISGNSPQNFNSIVTYTIKSGDGKTKQYAVKFTDTNLPALYISTNNREIQSKTTYISGTLKIKKNITGDALFDGEIEIRGRGNSTWGLPKKPYKIRLNKKAALLGMNESKQWVLLANYADKSLIRNEIGFELSRRLGLSFTPAGKFVDVILNGLYIGNYELVEQIDVGQKKVNIAEQNTSNISGGYLVELDGFANTEPVNFVTPRNMSVTVHYPESDKISLAQKKYIKDYFDTLENALFLNNSTDSTIDYKNYFDIDSYVNYYLVNEIIGNPDTFWSTYLYKNQDSDVIFTGPVWDFDIAANNDIRLGDVTKKLVLDAAHEPKLWINMLMKDKVFRNKVRKRWNEIYNKLEMAPFIDDLANKLSISQKKNFTKWPILTEKIYLNFQVAGSYEGEINYLKNYLNNRIIWLNSQFNNSRFD